MATTDVDGGAVAVAVAAGPAVVADCADVELPPVAGGVERLSVLDVHEVAVSASAVAVAAAAIEKIDAFAERCRRGGTIRGGCHTGATVKRRRAHLRLRWLATLVDP